MVSLKAENDPALFLRGVLWLFLGGGLGLVFTFLPTFWRVKGDWLRSTLEYSTKVFFFLWMCLWMVSSKLLGQSLIALRDTVLDKNDKKPSR